MVGYSEILQTMAAMVLFSLILMSSNRIIHLNTMKEVESEVEQTAIALAQTLIDEARVKPFDSETVDKIPVNIPDDFTACGPSGTSSEDSREEFNDFDDYHGWTETVTTALGANSFDLSVGVRYVSPPDYDFDAGNTTNPTEFKKMRVTVTSPFHTNNNGQPVPIELECLRRYYKQ